MSDVWWTFQPAQSGFVQALASGSYPLAVSGGGVPGGAASAYLYPHTSTSGYVATTISGLTSAQLQYRSLASTSGTALHPYQPPDPDVHGFWPVSSPPSFANGPTSVYAVLFRLLRHRTGFRYWQPGRGPVPMSTLGPVRAPPVGVGELDFRAAQGARIWRHVSGAFLRRSFKISVVATNRLGKVEPSAGPAMLPGEIPGGALPRSPG